MKRIVVEVNQIATFAMTGKIVDVARTVVRSDKIVGLVETVDGFVKLTIKTSDEALPFTVVINNDFDEVADFMVE